MKLTGGIPTLEDYSNLLETSLFKEMKGFSNLFLKENKPMLKSYHWARDPFHNWSRQWEYPFCYSEIENYIGQNLSFSIINIMDAGAGITFFPYFIVNKIKNTKVFCVDNDNSFSKIFSRIKFENQNKIDFTHSDIKKLPFEDNFFDIVYCISVLEHADNYFEILAEFKRVLKKNGILIITFDISLDGQAEIPPQKLKELFNILKKDFSFLNFQFSNDNLDLILNKNNILTTDYIRKKNSNLLPWNYSIFSLPHIIKSLLTFKTPSFFRSLTCFCGALVKTDIL